MAFLEVGFQADEFFVHVGFFGEHGEFDGDAFFGDAVFGIEFFHALSEPLGVGGLEIGEVAPHDFDGVAHLGDLILGVLGEGFSFGDAGFVEIRDGFVEYFGEGFLDLVEVLFFFFLVEDAFQLGEGVEGEGVGGTHEAGEVPGGVDVAFCDFGVALDGGGRAGAFVAADGKVEFAAGDFGFEAVAEVAFEEAPCGGEAHGAIKKAVIDGAQFHGVGIAVNFTGGAAESCHAAGHGFPWV